MLREVVADGGDPDPACQEFGSFYGERQILCFGVVGRPLQQPGQDENAQQASASIKITVRARVNLRLPSRPLSRAQVSSQRTAQQAGILVLSLGSATRYNIYRDTFIRRQGHRRLVPRLGHPPGAASLPTVALAGGSAQAGSTEPSEGPPGVEHPAWQSTGKTAG